MSNKEKLVLIGIIIFLVLFISLARWAEEDTEYYPLDKWPCHLYPQHCNLEEIEE